MLLKTIKLLDFRNYSNLSIELPERGALFVGTNGSGKTNILEAISFLIVGKSVRSASIRDMINSEKNESFISATFTDKSTQSIGFSKSKNIIIKKNGVESSSLTSLYGNYKYIYFGPDDIELINGSPDIKRKYLNMIISQNSRDYLQNLINYNKVLSQRNRLINSSFDSVLMNIYNEQIAKLSFEIVNKRLDFFNNISDRVSNIYENIGNSDISIKVVYSPSIKFSSLNEYIECFNDRVNRDLESGFTTTGPHRDSFKFYANDKTIGNFASQGQCRTTALAFKLSTVDYLSNNKNRELIIAVDDALSDIDSNRKQSFFSLIKDKGQILMAIHSEEEAKNYPLLQFNIKNSEIKSAS
jgi:DNA replication and repair protein RecF